MSEDVVAQRVSQVGAEGHGLPSSEKIESVAIGRVCIDGTFVVPLTPEQQDRRFVIHAQEFAAEINSKRKPGHSVGFGQGQDSPKANRK